MASKCTECGVAEGQHHLLDCPYYVAIMGPGQTTGAPITIHPKVVVSIALPPEVMQYQHDIRRFVEAMVYKLVKHSNKGRWEKVDIEKALGLLDGEVDELREAMQRGNMVEILLEAADVANYGLIISAIAMERGK